MCSQSPLCEVSVLGPINSFSIQGDPRFCHTSLLQKSSRSPSLRFLILQLFLLSTDLYRLKSALLETPVHYWSFLPLTVSQLLGCVSGFSLGPLGAWPLLPAQRLGEPTAADFVGVTYYSWLNASPRSRRSSLVGSPTTGPGSAAFELLSQRRSGTI